MTLSSQPLLTWLVEEHAPALILYARTWCDTPEDVVQEALVQLVRQQSPPATVLPWLYRVVKNGALSARRASNRRRNHEAAAAWRGEPWFAAQSADQLDARAASEALAALPEEQKEVIVARLWGGLSFEQIAALAGCSSSTAHRRYAAGLLELQERLGSKCIIE